MPISIEEDSNQRPHAFEPTEGRPELPREAWCGIVGEILDLTGPYTEADPAGVLATSMATFSCMIGPGKKVVGPITQPINLWFILMGETGIGRKGTADNVSSTVMASVEPHFWDNCRTPSLSTGEGLTYSVRDITQSELAKLLGEDADESDIEDQQPDKRLLVTSTEFAGVMSKSQGGTLGPVLRDAWDGKNLAIHTKDAFHSTGPHISVIGHVTPAEFGAKLKAHDMAGGTYNRFLPMFVEMPHELPWPEFPGDYITKLDSVSERLAEALKFSNSVDEVTFTDEAKQFYVSNIYREYNDTRGDSETMKQFTTRRLPYVLRVAAVYALMNRCDKVEIGHLKAAKAVVDYAINSAQFIEDRFSTEYIGIKSRSSRGPQRRTMAEDALTLREALDRAGGVGLSKTVITVKVLGTRRSAKEIKELLDMIGAASKKIKVPGGTKHRETWYLPHHIEGE